MRRPLLSLILAGALGSGLLTAGAPPARAATDSVTLAGSLQSELGCPADWQAGCAATHLARVAGTATWQGTFHVPAGSWEFKIAANDSWDVNYGAEGVAGGANVPLSLVGAADLVFSFDADTHRIGIQPAKLSGPPPPRTACWSRVRCGRPRRTSGSYFLMADSLRERRSVQ